MLYFVYNYAGTLLAIATAIGGVLVAFFKWGGKTVVEEWLKRNYKAWELEAEKPYKEDFKRFEDKIDAIANRSQYKFEHIHEKKVEIATQVRNQCSEVMGRCFTFLLTMPFNRKNIDKAHGKIAEHQDAIGRGISEIANTLSTNTVYIPKTLHEAAGKFMFSVGKLMEVAFDVEQADILPVFQPVNEKYEIVNNLVRELVGSDIV